jgi:hypothetical protein
MSTLSPALRPAIGPKQPGTFHVFKSLQARLCDVSAGCLSRWRRWSDGRRARPAQGPDGRDRASIDPKEVWHSIPAGALRGGLRQSPVSRNNGYRKQRANDGQRSTRGVFNLLRELSRGEALPAGCTGHSQSTADGRSLFKGGRLVRFLDGW